MQIEELVARQEIWDALMRYVRGVDRRDAEMIASAYHSDAVDIRSYRPDGMPPGELARKAVAGWGESDPFSEHHTTNVLYDIDLEAGIATVESYVLVLQPVSPDNVLPGFRPPAGRARTIFAGGRYVDRFERRVGAGWRIARRVLVVDWAKEDLLGADDPVLTSHPEGLAPAPAGADPSDTWRADRELGTGLSGPTAVTSAG